MYVVSAGFVIAAAIARWLPVFSAAIIIFSLTWLGLSCTPREIHIQKTWGRLPSRHEFLRNLPAGTPESDSDECAICMEPYNKVDRLPCRLPCRHMYCRSCLELLFKTQKAQYCCPECKQLLFRPIPPWKHLLVKSNICSVVAFMIVCWIRLAWDVWMLCRAGESIFTTAEMYLCSQPLIASTSIVTLYWPYFASSDADHWRERLVYGWVKLPEIGVWLPLAIYVTSALQEEVGAWWVADSFRKIPNSYVVTDVIMQSVL